MNRSMIATIVLLLAAAPAIAGGGTGIGKGSPQAAMQPSDDSSGRHAKGHKGDSGKQGANRHHKRGAAGATAPSEDR